MNRWITVLAYLGLSCIVGLGCTARQQCADTDASRPRNLVVIVIDALRADQPKLPGF